MNRPVRSIVEIVVIAVAAGFILQLLGDNGALKEAIRDREENIDRIEQKRAVLADSLDRIADLRAAEKAERTILERERDRAVGALISAEKDLREWTDQPRTDYAGTDSALAAELDSIIRQLGPAGR